MTIETLYEHFLKCKSVCTDTRNISENCMFFALQGGNFNGNKFAEDAIKNGASFAIIDDIEYKINDQYLMVDDVLIALQNLALFHRKHLNTPIISLTGSNGKTTTKELVNAVLSKKYKTTATKGNLNNHIGVPLTLLSMNNTTEIGIVEMGANHQKEIEFLSNIALPDYGLITNFGKAHLEGFGSIEGVIKGKSELYQHLKVNSKIIFVNHHDELQIKQVGAYDHIEVFGSKTQLLESQPYLSLSYEQQTIKSHLTGSYNYNNVCVAIALGEYFKVSTKDIVDAIENYIPSNNRSQIVNQNGHQIILDAYNANPSSMLAALSNFNQLKNENKVVILGDMFELGETAPEEHQHISDYTSDLKLKNAIFVGENFYNIKSKNSNSNYFKSFEDLNAHFGNFNFNQQLFLIKGSRGMALERVLNLI
ncbi:UDP-N-acetylmuramoyl-tripeptide--D-alanyl-D-alanine ligase [Psychroserpens burtonensis]|uniref:UDP-N-acetylmuramoyl-tripeptide--D-alanyl-D-alanine ligase n=1 Tax=Psychroserpens burtonensis TaxID=49278 RepID=A0A5C7B483_9FLAO|nr:UDP-N-acetylmuramoyl-tripeptide--D-alanyl-D-alanine ligase [Psychroserpens burtonensis]TXE15543.1 UDP-N-acetylmuramoyl-tripeptide--D-alanyl-D-alanine ligase [Psychroserpens burtonensis]